MLYIPFMNEYPVLSHKSDKTHFFKNSNINTSDALCFAKSKEDFRCGYAHQAGHSHPRLFWDYPATVFLSFVFGLSDRNQSREKVSSSEG